MTRPQVLIIQAMCKQYRVPLFARMYDELAASGIDLKVVYSEPATSHRERNDDVDLPPTYGVKIAARTWLDGRIYWQMPLQAIRAADLIIVEFALKHVISYPLLALARLRLKKIGFWLHGGTLRYASKSWLHRLRRETLSAADWVFPYTIGGSEIVTKLGFPGERVTPLINAIDLREFREALSSVTELQLTAARNRLGLRPDAQVALFCGSIYPGRGIEFLLQVGDILAEANRHFHLVVIGSGPLFEELRQACSQRPWLHLLGSLFGSERAVYFRLAQVCLMPFLAGLGILDAMAAGLPYFVTGVRATNPEIEYLIDGVTGVVAGEDPAGFAAAVHELLEDKDRLCQMSESARTASLEYSIERMSANFCRGIRACLAQEPKCTSL